MIILAPGRLCWLHGQVWAGCGTFQTLRPRWRVRAPCWGPPCGWGQIYSRAGSWQRFGSILDLLLPDGSPQGWGSCAGPGQDLPVPVSIIPPMAHSCSDLAGNGGTPSAPLELQLCQDALSMRACLLPRPKEAARSAGIPREAAEGGLDAMSWRGWGSCPAGWRGAS